MDKDNTILIIVIVVIFVFTILTNLDVSSFDNFIMKIFNNAIFRIAVLLIIFIQGNECPLIALILAIIFMLSLNYINELEIKENFINNKNYKK